MQRLSIQINRIFDQLNVKLDSSCFKVKTANFQNIREVKQNSRSGCANEATHVR